MAGFLSQPGARPAFVLSILLSIFGSIGTLAGSLYLMAPLGGTTAPLGETSQERQQRELLEPLMHSDLTAAAAVGNLLASALLLIASFLTTARRRSSLWWIRQAVWANVLYTLANCGRTLYQIWLIAPAQVELIRADAANHTPEEAAQIADAAPALPWAFGTGVVLAALVMLGVYALMLRLHRRDDVRAFVHAAPPSEPPA